MSTEVGRNEPCPCGSGRKYKRCCGAEAKAPAANVSTDSPAAPNGSEAMGAGMGGFDPSQMDPQMMMQMAQALQRLPRNQMNKLQSIMQRAMAGKDVSKEAAELERMLPPKFKQMMEQFQPQMAAGLSAMGGATPQTPHEVEELIAEEIGEQTTEDTAGADMSADSAREIVKKAVQEGKISPEEAKRLLGEADAAAAESGAKSNDSKKSIFRKLWK